MRPALDSGASIHDPGPVTLGVFEDIGWNTVLNRVSPDLVISNILVSTSGVQVVISNQGTGPVLPNQGFWVDAYINPTVPPTSVNQIWDTIASQGLVWGIDNPNLTITPGMTLTLSIDDQYFRADLSNFSGTIAPGSVIYGQVDSANSESSLGGVIETDELNAGPYNNIAGPVQLTSTVTTTVSTAMGSNVHVVTTLNMDSNHATPSPLPFRK